MGCPYQLIAGDALRCQLAEAIVDAEVLVDADGCRRCQQLRPPSASRPNAVVASHVYATAARQGRQDLQATMRRFLRRARSRRMTAVVPRAAAERSPAGCHHGGEHLGGGCCGQAPYWACALHGEATVARCTTCPDWLPRESLAGGDGVPADAPADS